MPITVTVNKPTQLTIDSVRLILPVNYNEEDMPNDFPFRTGNMWDVTIDIETGQIRNWPKGVAHDLYMKVTDGGTYQLLDANGAVVAEIEENYVPNKLIPGEYGDYVDLDIADDGVVMNWPKRPNVSEFFQKAK